MNGKETKATVAKAQAAFNAQREYMLKSWGSVTVTETYDPHFVSARNELRRLFAALTVAREALAIGM